MDILEAEHLFSTTQPLPSERFRFLSVHNYRPLFCVHKDWIYWIYDTTKTKSRHSNLIDVTKAIFQSRLSSARLELVTRSVWNCGTLLWTGLQMVYAAWSVGKIMEMFMNTITSSHRCLWRDYFFHINCGQCSLCVYFQENEKVCGYAESQRPPRKSLLATPSK